MIKDILLVDDDADDISIFEEALNDVDSLINFHSAKNGVKALEFLLSGQSNAPDLIFLDINMPEMNGWQCLSKLKSTPRLQQIPVILYSTSASKMDEQKAYSLGAIAIYQKPERFEKLKYIINSIVKDFV